MKEMMKIMMMILLGSTCEDLSGILKLLLMKKLTNEIKDVKNIKYDLVYNMKDILNTIKYSIHLMGEEDTKSMIEEKKFVNIYLYSQNLTIINSKNINDLITKYLSEKEQKEKIELYWKTLSNYISYNSFFELNFINHLKKSLFDYSLISINILRGDNSDLYEKSANECLNKDKEKKLLYFISNMNNNIKIIDKIKLHLIQVIKKKILTMGKSSQ